MKNLRNILAATVFGLLSILPPTSYALDQQTGDQVAAPQKPTFRMGIYRKVNTLTMNLLIEKKLGDLVVIKLLDERGRVLHKEALSRKRQKYSRLLNFEAARDGNYTVVVSNGAEQIVQEIHLSTQTLYEMPKRLLLAD